LQNMQPCKMLLENNDGSRYTVSICHRISNRLDIRFIVGIAHPDDAIYQIRKAAGMINGEISCITSRCPDGSAPRILLTHESLFSAWGAIYGLRPRKLIWQWLAEPGDGVCGNGKSTASLR